MPGRSLISLTSMTFCFLRASFLRFCSSYLNLPKSRILHTGGSALGDTSTRSRPASMARARASFRGTTPSISPRSLTRRTRGTLISSLMRGPSLRGGGGAWVERGGMRQLLTCCGRRGRRRRPGLSAQSSDGLAEFKEFLIFGAQTPDRDAPVFGFAAADHQQSRYLGEAVLAHLVVNLFVGKIDPDTQPRGRTGGAHL